MSDDQKQPGVAFWATLAVVVVLVLYPLSAGPAAWLVTVAGEPVWLEDVFELSYLPVNLAVSMMPAPINDACNGYLSWWASLAQP